MDTATRLVVGVAGGTGSGKTTFARDLIAALPAGSAQIVDHDAYYRDLSDREFAERCAVDFDHPDSLETELLCEHLAALRDGAPIRKPVYDFTRHVRAHPSVEVRPTPAVVVEGILVLADPNLREQIDLAFFVDTPADIRLARRIRRDVDERGRSVESVLDQYERSVRPAHERHVAPSKAFADLVVPGTRGFVRARRIAAAAIRHNLEQALRDGGGER